DVGALNDVTIGSLTSRDERSDEVTKEEESGDDSLFYAQCANSCAALAITTRQAALFVLSKHKRGDQKVGDYAHDKQH
ncbi:hypothetical protein M9458_052973, partial [Cirrhinus mrigala]